LGTIATPPLRMASKARAASPLMSGRLMDVSV
jgi:hypothetical protein